ncbi:MAG TPA: flagellar biosynthesis protein FlhF [Tepidisphaeraceae bacterium]|jgi:flagellar biosynthesis protein FlhF
MNMQVFKASTMAEALAEVKRTMGSDAVILHTRTYQRRRWMGLRRQEIVEITAGRGLNVAHRPRRAIKPAVAPANNGAAISALAQRRNPQPTEAPANPIDGGRMLLQTPAASNAMMLNLSQEMTQLRSMVKDLVVETRHKQSPQVPEDLFEYYLQLVQNQVASELAQEMMQTIQKQCRPEHLAQPSFVREKIAEQLEKLLPMGGPIVRTKTRGTHVVALVGPTGVGKTTTIAKLAANLKLREKHRVGLITLDTYRIAATDQLKKYADIIGSPMRVVSNPEDLRAAIDSMHECEFVLIDTAGRSPNDTMKINELKNFLAVAKPDETHLVLSTTASEKCVELAIERFGCVGVDKIIFTKIDEAAHIGVVLNVVKKLNISLSYITTGQDVPNDIEVGRGRRLAQLIMGSGV